ncbi:MAG: hypothetical protein HN932_12915 [Candidatus Marinimicrobia bacterium]|jgi:hypothetical protein|nr:hypothetical protein [Candidatus Neomarinimicrobiota bacterium]MBT7339116.1 hypothetical protein [Candidatus Jacksonbacteria bacterium]
MGKESTGIVGNPNIDLSMVDDGSDGNADFFEALDLKVNGSQFDLSGEDDNEGFPAPVPQGNPEGRRGDGVTAKKSPKRREGSSSSGQTELEERLANLEGRYSDSSREAQRLAAENKELQELKTFAPILQAMKQDSGLVDYVEDYLTSGGKPAKSIQEQLGLGEDFHFNADEALDQDTDSGKVLATYVDKMVQKRASDLINQEKVRAHQTQLQIKQQQEAKVFMKERGMTEEQFGDMMARAKSHIMTLPDLDLILNRENATKNIANAQKKEMLEQMQGVRKLPTSQGAAISSDDGGDSRSQDDVLFDRMLSTEDNLDNIFDFEIS